MFKKFVGVLLVGTLCLSLMLVNKENKVKQLAADDKPPVINAIVSVG